MKILYLGDLAPGQTCRMRMRALQRLGHEVVGVDTVAPWKCASWLQRQWQRRLQRGSIPRAINRSVLKTARALRPEILWADKQEYLRAETLEEISRLGTRTVHFTPDPYFSLPWKQTPVMNAALRSFDGIACCKRYEISQYQALGKPVHQMPLGYCDETHRPISSDAPKWSCAVGFLGGWEPRREAYLSRVAASGLDLQVRGGYWDFLRDGRWTPRRAIILRQLAGSERFRIHRNEILAGCLRGGEVYGDDYARALTGARIGVGFLRKVCPDQHTTRSFEIPACGSMLLADRTDEHRAFFEEGKEADFFGSEDELADKLDFYSKNEATRSRIALAGYERCQNSRYAYIHRMREAVEWVQRKVM
jgi:spore maturation protein CgeB